MEKKYTENEVELLLEAERAKIITVVLKNILYTEMEVIGLIDEFCYKHQGAEITERKIKEFLKKNY